MLEKVQKKIRQKLISQLNRNRLIRKLLRINSHSEEELQKSEVVIYFFGGPGQTYQINQWINTFMSLDKKHEITILVRNIGVYFKWRKELPLKKIHHCNTINEVLEFYDTYDPKVIIYINNGFKNFQSLIYNDAMHIHINHGESDKSSDHSNQIKGYDYVFVHGPNGFNNYMKYLIKIDPNKFVQTGRPQLDFIEPITLNTFGKKVILYAPTWEATHRSMRYTSVDVYGEKIVDTVLENDDYFFIYKPHPNLGAYDNNVLKIHNILLKKTIKSKYAITITNRDVNDIYPVVDFAIFDMSSIMTDYLNVDKPFILADVFDRSIHNVEAYNVLDACNRLTGENIDQLEKLIIREITNDPLKEKRKEIKNLYLGNYRQGESIQKFISSISKIIEQRDTEIENKYKDKSA